MKKFYDLEIQRKQEIFNQASAQTGLPAAAIEKDWWVTLVLKSIFTLPYHQQIVFKGGTSLSKGWNLIERFSEDIDLAIDRAFFGFEGDLGKAQIRRLRRLSCRFFSTEFPKDIEVKIKEMGIPDFQIIISDFDAGDTDPIEIKIEYLSTTERSDYIKPGVLIEINSRSLIEPVENRSIQSKLGETFFNASFADQPAILPLVLPRRTFLEKAFLLHEEFQRPLEKLNSERKSRHLYDLEKMMDTEHGLSALEDTILYKTIVEHREKFTHLSSVDYTTLMPDKIDFIPPEPVIAEWEADYKRMRENMIYGVTLDFDHLIGRLIELMYRFRGITLT